MTDVLAQWPAALVVPAAHEPAKLAAADTLEALVPRLVAAGEKTAAYAGEGRGDVTKGNIWRHHDAHPLVLLAMVLDRYGDDSLWWEPETVRGSLERDNIALSQSAWTKILAARPLLTSPSPWRQWNAFAVTCRGLAGIAPNFVYFEEPDVGHLMAGVEMMHIVDPSRQLGDEVDAFVAAVLKDDSQPFAPPPLTEAQTLLEGRQIECKNCGAIHFDNNDVTCVTCGGKALAKIPYPFLSLKNAVESLWTQRHTFSFDRATKGLPDDAAGNCARRLFAYNEYARRIAGSLLPQLKMVR